ncbi:FAD-dependent oxidoreductase [Klebsiella pneumoniae]|nr:FAD-dependent oxidoreductase [Klebsiella pneumoniae]
MTVVGDEPHPAYNRIQLSPLLAGEKKNGGADPAAAGGVVHPARCLRSGEAVDEADIQQTGGCASRKPSLPWDELVFATGSRPFVPPPQGTDRPQVMPFRTLAGRGNVFWAIPGPAVVIGGGVLGWKRRRRCVVTGGEVTLLHRGSGLAGAPLTDAFVADELRQQLEARGIRCVLEAPHRRHRRRWRAAGGRARIPRRQSGAGYRRAA